MKRLSILATALLAAIATPAPAAWQQATSNHFIVYQNGSAEELKALTERLERYDSAMRTNWHLKDRPETPSSRVTLYMVDGLDALHRLLGQGSENLGGIYLGRAGQSVSFMPARVAGDTAGYSRGTLYHEYAHHVMRTGWGDQVFPAWFSEGFAEFHSTARFSADGGVIFGAEPRGRQFNVRNSALMPVETLLTTSPNWSNAMTGDAFYARAWLLTDYLVLSPTGPKRFAAYITALNGGLPLQKAALSLGSARQLEQEMNAWLNQRALQTRSVPASALSVGKIEVRALAPDEAAILPLRMTSEHGVTKETAPQVAKAMRQIAAQYPNSTTVQNALAEAEYDVDNFPASLAAADRAAALDPKSVHALLYKGMATIAQLKKDKATDPAIWTAARRSYLAANKVDAEDPRPLWYYYRSFGEAGQAATPNAQSGLLYAQALAPFDTALRITTGMMLLGQAKTAEAKAILQPVAFNPHAGELAKLVGDALSKLDTEGSKAALEVLQKDPDSDKPGS